MQSPSMAREPQVLTIHLQPLEPAILIDLQPVGELDVRAGAQFRMLRGAAHIAESDRLDRIAAVRGKLHFQMPAAHDARVHDLEIAVEYRLGKSLSPGTGAAQHPRRVQRQLGAAQRAVRMNHALQRLAVGAHGYVRATTGVNFLVGEEAFEHQRSLVAFKAGVLIEVDGIRIDYLSPVALGPQLEEVLDHPPMSEGLAVVPIEVLIYMKLAAKRRKDLVDVIELVKAGADLTRGRDYLRQYAGDLLPLFEELVNEALAE